MFGVYLYIEKGVNSNDTIDERKMKFLRSFSEHFLSHIYIIFLFYFILFSLF